MTGPSDVDASVADGTQTRREPRALARWLVSYGTFSVPQAAAPIAFALLALPITGNPRSGSAIVMVFTLAQVVGAVPVARYGRSGNATSFLRTLIAVRTLALAAVAASAFVGASFSLLLVFAALAGSVNGAAFGYLRSILNHLVEAPQMPRALGLAATLSEFTFVAAPVLASVLGTVDPILGLLVVTMLGATTVILVPSVPCASAPAPVRGGSRLLKPAILLWLGCTIASSVVVSSIEVGAVSMAMQYGFEPAQGFIFTVALCVASVTGGVWVSVLNRPPRRATVLGYLVVMSAGAALLAANFSVVSTLAGAIMVGGVLAPLSTSYSLQLDVLAPAHRRAEVFALARTATAIGVILTSTNSHPDVASSHPNGGNRCGLHGYNGRRDRVAGRSPQRLAECPNRRLAGRST